MTCILAELSQLENELFQSQKVYHVHHMCITCATFTTLGWHAIHWCVRKVDTRILIAFKASKRLFGD
jgi:hypothetical protein